MIESASRHHGTSPSPDGCLTSSLPLGDQRANCRARAARESITLGTCAGSAFNRAASAIRPNRTAIVTTKTVKTDAIAIKPTTHAWLTPVSRVVILAPNDERPSGYAEGP